ncbi:MAG: hypothetical protein NTV99_07935 [Deltaproteobacteria bacterium]|nr:hypothetical protein [Deltaproteobacteria bacterium]
MKNTENTFRENLDILARILIRCFIGGVLLLLIWFMSFTFGGGWIYSFHSKWFQIPLQTFEAIHYAGMAFTKILLILFFLIPYIVIRLVSKKKG